MTAKARLRTIIPLAVGVLAPIAAQAIWFNQTVSLKQGWNAIYMRVNPYDYGCDKVFGGGGIDQVAWWRLDVSDDGKGTVSSDMFSWYAHSAEPSTFGAVLGDECYLVHAVAATNLTVVGTPALPRGRLALGRANLVGMNLPTSGLSETYADYWQYFSGLSGDPYGQLSAANEAISVGAGTKLGNAYMAFWLTTAGSGSATYTGPLAVTTDTSDKIIAWTGSTAARTLTVRNASTVARKVTFGMEASAAVPAGQGSNAGLVRVKIESIDWSQGYARRVYTPVAFPFTTNLAAGASFAFKMRPNLDLMKATPSGDYLGILTVSDKGSVINGSTRTSGTCLYRVGVKAAGSLAADRDPAGLWVGSVALTGVNRAKMFSSAEPEWDPEEIQDTTQAFQFRLILHAADDGKVSLLKQAFVGSTTADNEVATVMTDKKTAQAFRRKYPNGTIRRVSSANFPFMAPQALDGEQNFMRDGGKMSVSFTQSYDAKDNPFQHQFHPNHDNLAFNNGKPSKKEDGAAGTGDYESWNVTRRVTLTFAGKDPTGANEDWNRTVCGGVYREEITGLNKTPVIVEGAFRLYKSLDTPELTSGSVVP